MGCPLAGTEVLAGSLRTLYVYVSLQGVPTGRSMKPSTDNCLNQHLSMLTSGWAASPKGRGK